MSRSFEVHDPEGDKGGPPVQLERPRSPGVALPFALLLGFLGGVIFGTPLVGAFLGFGYWLLNRLDS